MFPLRYNNELKYRTREKVAAFPSRFSMQNVPVSGAHILARAVLRIGLLFLTCPAFRQSGMGILRVIHVDPNAVSDWIPVDVVANVCIAAAMATALAPQGTATLPHAWDAFALATTAHTHNVVPSFPEQIVRERKILERWKGPFHTFPNFLAKTCMHKMYVGREKRKEIC
jgi:hypothetical protein